MQMGVTMLECGHVHSKSVSNILIKNVIDLFISALAFYLFGFSFMNNAQGGFLGTNVYFMSTGLTHDEILLWLYQFSFCSMCATIVSGSLVDRVYVDSYIVFAFLMAAFIYPICASWSWGGGWLSVIGFQDYAGSGVVHLLGGVSGLVGSIIIGPRVGAFEAVQKQKTEAQFSSKRVKRETKSKK
jgi:ammonium transporter, Amt family